MKLIPAYDGRVDDNHTDKNVYVNPVYLTTIVAGSAGSKEKLSDGKAPHRALAEYIEEYGWVDLAPILLRCKARKRYPGIHASIIDKEAKRAVRFYRSQKKREGQVDDFKNVLDVITHFCSHVRSISFAVLYSILPRNTKRARVFNFNPNWTNGQFEFFFMQNFWCVIWLGHVFHNFPSAAMVISRP